ncbi:transposase [Micromonospora fulviviridis]|uniref:transposase n=1 Tax=Micromonospora fulviviridis TaxID=47860 RepID=UPI0037AF9BD0
MVAVGDLSTFVSPDHLAACAGLAPVARGFGRRVANLRRPQRYTGGCGTCSTCLR